ncbi:Hypothetical_protein [Hexamita inflata]|uniref:Hypothetical_protein n=1 Tax=Hexamita inflata TaxID=28002 RepID=A0ABP1H8F0_9EUKA
MSSMCLQFDIIGQTTDFSWVGIIGSSSVNISLDGAQVIQSIQGKNFKYVGTIGEQDYAYTQIQYLSITVYLISQMGSQVGSIYGSQTALNCSISGARIYKSNISSGYEIGGFIGYSDSNTTIFGSSISDLNISGQNYVGGLISQTKQTLYLIEANTYDLFLYCSNSVFGAVVAQLVGTWTVSKCSSQSTINGVMLEYCWVLSNIWSVRGC